VRYTIAGLNCGNCAAKIEAEIRNLPGLEKTVLNFASGTVDIPPSRRETVQQIIDRIEPGARLVPSGSSSSPEATEWLTWLAPVLAGLFLGLGLFLQYVTRAQWMNWGRYPIFLGSYLLVGWPVLLRAGQNLLRGAVMDEHFLMSVASLGAIGIGELPEATAVMVFYAVGERLQEMAVGKSRRSISALLGVRPDTAHVMRAGDVVTVHPEQVEVGEVILIRPGERVPLDGDVLSGNTLLDTSALTGESVPRRAAPGDTILAGSINLQGALEVRVSRVFGESSVARILELVEKASDRKAPAEKFITSFARYYTPVVVISAVLLAVVPPLTIPGATFTEWIYRALVLLVISCPCALVVSVPLTYFAGIGAASRQGVLFKGANFVDSLARAEVVVFDKTGTLTKGTFTVTEVLPAPGYSTQQLLRLAAESERHSLHPIAMSIKAAHPRGQTDVESTLTEFKEIPGRGISGRLDGREVLLGNRKWLAESGIEPVELERAGTVLYMALEGHFIGALVVSDEIRPDAHDTIHRMKDLGITQTVMLTGDREDVAAATARELGIDVWHANLLPEDKVSRLAEVSKGKRAIFVGDGINDAPVIASAEVGVAMGGLASDAAIESADVVLVDAKPSKLITALEIARHTAHIARQNIALSLGVKGLFLIMGAMGLASVWWAVFADVGVAVLAVLNALRALTPKRRGRFFLLHNPNSLTQ
jgi:Cd2+/Zn2+-exporting ATPase